MSLFKSAFTVGGLTLCSRILGYVRDIFIASSLGAGFLADAFFVAFRLPNFLRSISAEGAFNSSFVPIFSGKLEGEGREKALGFAEHVFSIMFVFLLVFSILMQILMPFVMYILAPGFIDEPEKFAVTVHLGRIVFPYLLFISLVSLFGGILNSIGKFAAGAAAPIWLNVSMIFAILYLAEFTETPAHALSFGVFIAGIVQLLWMVAVAYKNGIRLKFSFPKMDNDVRMLLRRMVPGIIGASVTQINLWINTIIATTMAGAVSYLYYADRLVQFPLAIVGTAMGTVLLPTLSKQIKTKDFSHAIRTQNRALEFTLLFTLPAAVALIVLAEPLIVVTLERGAFGHTETMATTAALIAYSFGLPAFVMIKVFAPGFFASGDTKTPVKIAVACLIFNVALSLSLIGYIGHVGLAIATSLSSWMNTLLLCYNLHKRGIYKADKELMKKLMKIAFSAAAMGLVLWYMRGFLAGYFASDFSDKMFALIALIITGVVTFFAATHITGGFKAGELVGMFSKKR